MAAASLGVALPWSEREGTAHTERVHRADGAERGTPHPRGPREQLRVRQRVDVASNTENNGAADHDCTDHTAGAFAYPGPPLGAVPNVEAEGGGQDG